MNVLILMHKSLIPPDIVDESTIEWDEVDWAAEYDVTKALKAIGHHVDQLGVISDLNLIREAIQEMKPSIIFNLLEEFDGEAVFDQNVVSYLELLKIPYTGCNPRGLMIARDKALSKKILAYHKIGVPKFCVFPRSQPKTRPKALEFPLIVKCLNEEASLGLTQASVVRSDEKLKERVKYINEELGVDAIAEQFIDGKEYYMGVIGNHRLTTLPPWELQFENSNNPEKEFYSNHAKFNFKYRQRKGIKTGPANLPDGVVKEMSRLAKNCYRALYLNGYARIDFRICTSGKIYVLEANPNPDISKLDDFAESAKHMKTSYKQLLKKIITLGRGWNPTASLSY